MNTFVGHFSPCNTVKTAYQKLVVVHFRTRFILNTDTFEGWRLPVAVVIMKLYDTIGLIYMMSLQGSEGWSGLQHSRGVPLRYLLFYFPLAVSGLQPAQRALRHESITLKLYCFGLLYRVGLQFYFDVSMRPFNPHLHCDDHFRLFW